MRLEDAKRTLLLAYPCSLVQRRRRSNSLLESCPVRDVPLNFRVHGHWKQIPSTLECTTHPDVCNPCNVDPDSECYGSDPLDQSKIIAGSAAAVQANPGRSCAAGTGWLVLIFNFYY